MAPGEFQKLLPIVCDWINDTLAAHASRALPVATFKFPRLGRFFNETLLNQTKVVPVDACPVPPLSAMGLSQFSEFESMSMDGITYLDTCFLVREHALRESLHFHELVHVVQWKTLGREGFLAVYVDGLEKHGYRNSPLEVMAYDHEARFNGGAAPYDVETEVRQQLQWIAEFPDRQG